jgi:hypothetical protein
LEVSVHALPEVKLSVEEPDPYDPDPDRRRRPPKTRPVVEIPPRTWPAIRYGVKIGTRTYWPTIFGAARRCGMAVWTPLAGSITRLRHKRETARGHTCDFGADTSLREDLALGQRIHYNALVDTMGHAERLQYRLIKAFADHLEACNVDIRDLIGKSETIITTNQQNIFNNLKAGAVTFGDNSPASGSVNHPRPAGGPQAPRSA